MNCITKQHVQPSRSVAVEPSTVEPSAVAVEPSIVADGAAAAVEPRPPQPRGGAITQSAEWKELMVTKNRVRSSSVSD